EAQRLAEASLAGHGDLADLSTRLAASRHRLAQARSVAAEAQAMLQSLARDADQRARRLRAIEGDLASWVARQANGTVQIETLRARAAELSSERDSLVEAPSQFAATRRSLLSEVADAEARRQAAADRLVEAETRLSAADRLSRE